MRLITSILILFFWVSSEGQIINGSSFYRPLVSAAPPSNTPLLDTYTGAAAAYSLRKLSSSYSGSAIRVRRSSDNTEQDIGFTSNGDLDTASLKTFVGSGNGFVTTWYDQSGNARNALQPISANQPRIVNSGIINITNGKPSIYFAGNPINLGISSFSANSTYFSIFLFFKTDATSTLQVPFSRFSTGGQRVFMFRLNTTTGGTPNTRVDVNVWSNNTTGNEYYTQQGVSTTNPSLFVYTYDGTLTASTLQSIRKNAVSYPLSLNGANNLISSLNSNSQGFLFGKADVNIQYWVGNFSELIYYDIRSINSSITGIESNINSYYSIY